MRNTASPAQPLAVYGSAHTSTTPWTTWSKRCEASANCWRECGLFVRYLLRPEFSPPLSGRVGDPFPSRRTHLALLRSEPLAKLGRFGSLDRGPQLRCAAAIRLLPAGLTTRLTRVPGALVAVGVVRLNPAVFPPSSSRISAIFASIWSRWCWYPISAAWRMDGSALIWGKTTTGSSGGSQNPKFPESDLSGWALKAQAESDLERHSGHFLSLPDGAAPLVCAQPRWNRQLQSSLFAALCATVPLRSPMS